MFLQDDDVVYSLSRRPPATGLKAQLLYWYRQLVDRDIVAVIRQDPALLQIHNRGEEFDRPAEDCFAQMQVSSASLTRNSKPRMLQVQTCLQVQSNSTALHSTTVRNLHLHIVSVCQTGTRVSTH